MSRFTCLVHLHVYYYTCINRLSQAKDCGLTTLVYLWSVSRMLRIAHKHFQDTFLEIYQGCEWHFRTPYLWHLTYLGSPICRSMYTTFIGSQSHQKSNKCSSFKVQKVLRAPTVFWHPPSHFESWLIQIETMIFLQLVQNNHESCRGVWIDDRRCACYGKKLIGSLTRDVMWLWCDQ